MTWTALLAILLGSIMGFLRSCGALDFPATVEAVASQSRQAGPTDAYRVTVKLGAVAAADLAPADRAEQFEDLVKALRGRQQSGRLVKIVGTPHHADGALRLDVTTERGAGLDSWVALLRELYPEPTSLEFRMEVLPEASYSDAPEYAELRRREPLWSGTSAEFEAFKKREIAAWRKARSGGEAAYPRPDARMFVVRRRGMEGTEAAHFAVVAAYASGEGPFGGHILENPRTGRDNLGMLVVLFEIRSEWQNALGAWTHANMGYPMAFLVNGELLTAPYIRGRLSDAIQIAVGRTDDAASETQALAESLQRGSRLYWISDIEVERVDAPSKDEDR